jgi:VWFA-related protein
VFEYQRLEEDSPPPASGLSTREARAPEAPPAKAQKTAQISASPAGEVKYKNRRLLVLFFDLSGMPVADQVRSRKAALKFVNAQITAADLVAVMAYSTTLNVLCDFTGDRDQLVNAIQSISVGETGTSYGSTGEAGEVDAGAAYTQDDSEFNIFNTDRKLVALESAARMLGNLPEKKALVYFASGITRTGIDNQAQLRSTVNAAVRANVSLYPVDSRGLVATAPLGDATQGSQGGQGMYSGTSQRSVQSSFQAQQEALYTLAADTGGKAMLDTNDLSEGSYRPRSRFRVTTSSATTARMPPWTAGTAASKFRSPKT